VKCTYFKRHLQSLLGLGPFDLVLTLGENKRVQWASVLQLQEASKKTAVPTCPTPRLCSQHTLAAVLSPPFTALGWGWSGHHRLLLWE